MPWSAAQLTTRLTNSVLPHQKGERRVEFDQLGCLSPVRGEVVLPAKQGVIHSRHVRGADVDAGRADCRITRRLFHGPSQ
jgi:hypothetical protein